MPHPAPPCWLLLAWAVACDSAPEPARAPPLPGPRAAGPPPPPAAFHAVPSFDLTAAPEGPKRPIVLISLDTVSAPHLALYGGRAQTPNLSALAASGLRATQARSSFPETCLSHWTMHSGLPPEAHGDAPAVSGSVSTLPTLAEIARLQGYATAAIIGGVTLTDASCGLARGFDRYDDRFPVDRADMKRPGAEVTRRAVAFLDAQDGPYLLFLHYFDAHFPYTPAPPWDRGDPDYEGRLTGADADLRPYRDGAAQASAADIRHVEALYEGELSELDALLAPVLDAAGPDALVLVTSDHGESFGHGYLFNHRDALWEEVLRVPFLMRGPGVPVGAVLDAPVGLIDVTPTLLALAGLPADRRMLGRNLAATWLAESAPAAPHLATTDPARPGRQRALVVGGRKVILREDEAQDFILDDDPTELRPLGSPDAAATLEAAWAVQQAQLEALAPFTVPAPARRVLPDDEAARLEALGYQVPGPPAPPR